MGDSEHRPMSYPLERSDDDNVTALQTPANPAAQRPPAVRTQNRLPVALIFACLVIVYTGFDISGGDVKSPSGEFSAP